MVPGMGSAKLLDKVELCSRLDGDRVAAKVVGLCSHAGGVRLGSSL